MSALGSADAAPIVVVGSINVDTILRVPHLPVPGETLTATSEVERHGGKGANQAVAAAAMLDGVAMIGSVGTDDRGARALAVLAGRGVDQSRVLAVRGTTGTATVIVEDAGENTIVRYPGANALLSVEHVTGSVRALASTESIVVVSLEIPMDAVEAAILTAAEVGARVILNPAPARPLPETVLPHCDYVVPNAIELTQVLDAGPATALFSAGAGEVIVTRGAGGAEVLERDGSVRLSVPAPRVKVVDTTGAGDAFVAALAVAVHDGLELADAVRFAVTAGTISITAVGARGSVPTRNRIAELMAEGETTA